MVNRPPPSQDDPYARARDAIASAMGRVMNGQTLGLTGAQASMLDLRAASDLAKAAAISQGMDTSRFDYTALSYEMFVEQEDPLIKLIEDGLISIGVHLKHGVVIILAKLLVSFGGVLAALLVPLAIALTAELNLASLNTAIINGEKEAAIEFLNNMIARLTDVALRAGLLKKLIERMTAILGKSIMDKLGKDLAALLEKIGEKLLPGIGIAIFLGTLLVQLFNQRDKIIQGMVEPAGGLAPAWA